MKKIIKKNKAITLISLIVTIIILLILAGVSIVSLGGENGLISKVKQAKKAQIKAEIREQLVLKLSELQVEKNGEATLDDVTQEWANTVLEDYQPIIKEDSSISGKKITMSKNGISGKYIIDEKLNIIEIEETTGSQLTYEVKSREGENLQVSVIVTNSENGLKTIEYNDGHVQNANGAKSVARDCTIKLGVEYKVKIISTDGEEKTETILINDYYQTITKNLGEGISIDNLAIKTAYNKPYQAAITTEDNIIIESLIVTMDGQGVTTSGNNIVDIDTGKIYIEKVTGDIEITVISKKLEILISEPYIGTSTTEIDSSKSVADNSQTRGTDKVYINFKATLEGINCVVTLKDDTSKTLPYEVMSNGEYTFVAKGTYNGKTIIKEDIKVTANKYTLAKNLVKYDAGKWTEDEIEDLKTKKLYDYNESRSKDAVFKLNDENGLNFTFGGFKAGDDRNKSIKPGDDIIDGNPMYDGWQILEIKDSNGNLISKETEIDQKLKDLGNEKIYVTKIVHSGSPENFVYIDTTSNDAYRAEYILSSGERGYSTLSDTNNTKINPRYWDMYKDKEYENKQMINNVHLMNYSEAVKIERTCTGGKYYLSNSANNKLLWFSSFNKNALDNYAAGHNRGVAGIRPVIEMNEGVYIESGDGTSAVPYVLEIEK